MSLASQRFTTTFYDDGHLLRQQDTTVGIQADSHKCRLDSAGQRNTLPVRSHWGTDLGCPADFDLNGTVGATDLLALLFNWGPCP